MKFIWNILLACTIFSCHSGVEKSAKPHPHKIKNKEAGNHKDTKAKPSQHEPMEFVEYNDDGDYFLVIAKKKDSLFSFINNESNDRSLLRGDLIDVAWETATIEIAGDGGTQERAQKIVSILKIKDGNVAKFRLHYQKALKYTWPEEENYSTYYLDKLYNLVEYYIANSRNELLKLHIKNRDQLTYSIEKQTRNDKEYIMIGISTTSENHVNTIQWLYVEKTENILYEYDLANDRLVRFD
jgi:hypothetical protein